MDRGGWRATVHGVTESWTLLSDYIITPTLVFSGLTRMCLHVFSCFFLLEIC